MTTPFAVFLFVVGATVSLGASIILVSRIERVAVRIGCPEAILGLLTALAADAPEVTSAVSALLQHQNNIGVGVVLGSNVFNLAALLGLGAVVAGKIRLHRRVIVFAGPVAIWVACVCGLVLTRAVTPSVALLLALVVVIPYIAISASLPTRLPVPRSMMTWLRSAVAEEELELGDIHDIRPATRADVSVAVTALVVVTIASVAMERSASSLGQSWDVSTIVVGAIVLAAVTSLPNAVGAVYLARRNRGAAVLSEALNSNTLNVIVGLLIPSVILGLGTTSTETSLIVTWYIALTCCALVLAYLFRGLGRRSGSVIIAGYIAFAIAVVAS